MLNVVFSSVELLDGLEPASASSSHHLLGPGQRGPASLDPARRCVVDNEGLVLEHDEFVLESLLQLDAVVELLNGCELEARVHDLLYVVDLDQMARRRQLDRIHLLLGESILDLVRSYQGLLLFRGESAALIDQEPKLTDALFTWSEIKFLPSSCRCPLRCGRCRR